MTITRTNTVAIRNQTLSSSTKWPGSRPGGESGQVHEASCMQTPTRYPSSGTKLNYPEGGGTRI